MRAGSGSPIPPVAHMAVAAGLTPGQATLRAGFIAAAAVLVVGLLNFWAQRSQRQEQNKQLTKQLDVQREQLTTQLTEQREQTERQLAAQREQIERQLAAQRQLALIQLREETARLFRAEKRAIYIRMLDAVRTEQIAWQQLAAEQPDELAPDLVGLVQRVAAQKRATDELAAETELVASRETYELSQRFQQATTVLLRTLFAETDRRLEPGQRGDTTTFRQVQATLRQQIDQQNTGSLYAAMIEQMRSELFDLGLAPTLRPTGQEQDDLRQEVQGLDGDDSP